MTEEVTAPENQTQTQPETKPENSGSGFYKNKIQALTQELEQLRLERESLKETQLKEKENYKTLWENEKNKRTEAETKAQKVMESYFNGLKMSAIKEHALKLGIREEAIDDLSLIDHSSFVQIETTSTGNANVLGAKEFVEALKEKKSYWFTQSKAPEINNNGGGQFKEKVYTPADLLKLQKENPEEYKKAFASYIAKKNK